MEWTFSPEALGLGGAQALIGFLGVLLCIVCFYYLARKVLQIKEKSKKGKVSKLDMVKVGTLFACQVAFVAFVLSFFSQVSTYAPRLKINTPVTVYEREAVEELKEVPARTITDEERQKLLRDEQAKQKRELIDN